MGSVINTVKIQFILCISLPPPYVKYMCIEAVCRQVLTAFMTSLPGYLANMNQGLYGPRLSSISDWLFHISKPHKPSGHFICFPHLVSHLGFGVRCKLRTSIITNPFK
jgi:hypothetical protein